MTVTAKTFSYAVAVDVAGRLSADDGAGADVPTDWKPEHLVLAGLIECSLTSLRYHARRAEIEVTRTGGSASGRVTKRESDERYAFVEIDCALEVELDPAPPGYALADLLAKAERDCFVGASLTAAPRYRWTVNGKPATA